MPLRATQLKRSGFQWRRVVLEPNVSSHLTQPPSGVTRCARRSLPPWPTYKGLGTPYFCARLNDRRFGGVAVEPTPNVTLEREITGSGAQKSRVRFRWDY